MFSVLPVDLSVGYYLFIDESDIARKTVNISLITVMIKATGVVETYSVVVLLGSEFENFCLQVQAAKRFQTTQGQLFDDEFRSRTYIKYCAKSDSNIGHRVNFHNLNNAWI